MGAATTTMASDSLLQEISRERGERIMFLNKYDRNGVYHKHIDAIINSNSEVDNLLALYVNKCCKAELMHGDDITTLMAMCRDKVTVGNEFAMVEINKEYYTINFNGL